MKYVHHDQPYVLGYVSIIAVYGWGSRSIERFSDLPKITLQVSFRTAIRNCLLTARLMPNPLDHSVI